MIAAQPCPAGHAGRFGSGDAVMDGLQKIKDVAVKIDSFAMATKRAVPVTEGKRRKATGKTILLDFHIPCLAISGRKKQAVVIEILHQVMVESETACSTQMRAIMAVGELAVCKFPICVFQRIPTC